MNSTNVPSDNLKVETILGLIKQMPVVPLNPFEALLKREGFDPDRDEVLLIVPHDWLVSELGHWLSQPKKWLKLSRHVDQVYLMDVGKVERTSTRALKIWSSWAWSCCW